MAEQRPGIADTDRPRRGPFASLIEHASDSQVALDALLFAYEELDREERTALMDATARDARQPTIALAALHMVERDPTLQSRLSGLLAERARLERRATSWGSEAAGGACLRQWLDDGVCEQLTITWKDREIECLSLECERNSSFRAPGDPRDPNLVVEAVVPMLWAYLRAGGAMPDGAERFAGFFSFG